MDTAKSRSAGSKGAAGAGTVPSGNFTVFVLIE